jgi:diaminopimelate decarboxylase
VSSRAGTASIRYTLVVGFAPSPDGLLCDGVPLSKIAESEGTPLYVYSAQLVRDRYRTLDRAFGSYPHALHYALKANSTLALVSLLREQGSAADANSIWEIELARRAGILPEDIVFTGVGKTTAELERAVPLGLKAINVESPEELARIESIAVREGRVARVAIRVNPDIDANSHPHITTGLRASKFGIPLDLARDLVPGIGGREGLRLVALHVHVGSQITTLEPIRRAARLVARVARELGLLRTLEYLDLGGGLGISYDGVEVPTHAEYASALVDEVGPTALPIVLEPGRTVVGPAGVLVARVVDLKPRADGSTFAVIDAGMTEIMRPALYNAYHRVQPVHPRDGADRRYELVGPVCENSDVVARDRELPALAVGDLVAIRDAGAYGSAMASNYNRRPLPPEVLVDAGGWRLVRRRQTIDDMLSLEQL